MNVLIGLGLGGTFSSTGQEGSEGRARVGRPRWGGTGLLRDLELRLGLPPVAESASARLPRWVACIKALGDERAFYRRSFDADEIGTAAVLLEWRDMLVEAGWDGKDIEGCGERLRAPAILEHQRGEDMPLGRADRLVRVERALAKARGRIYESVTLVEPAALWPRRWQRIFERLQLLGTRLDVLEMKLPGAHPGSDLALVQSLLRGESGHGTIRGDRTFMLLRGDTPADLAELTAAILAERGNSDAHDLVVRCTDPHPLDAALLRHGLPSQGIGQESAWRPAMQILPLALETAFEPRDPHRVLELLTLPVGPFRGALGSRLARAVSRQPGVGGKEWQLQKAEAAQRIREHYVALERQGGRSDVEAERIATEIVAARMRLLDDWLEAPGIRTSAATKSELLAVVERVRTWVKGRIRAGDIALWGPVHAQIDMFSSALANDTRDSFTQEDVRQLLDRFARTEQSHDLAVESAGRIAHVAHPSSILGPWDGVIVWGFVGGVERRPTRLPWNDEELSALRAAGVSFVDPSALLRAEAGAWRRVVLAARDRVVLVAPRTIKGVATSSHSLWDEVCGRLGADDAMGARITCDVRAALDRRGDGLARVVACAPLQLPEGRGIWHVPGDAIRAAAGEASTSVTSLEKITTCPLAWVFERRAGFTMGAISSIASGSIRNGFLAHRLVEELHAEATFDLDEAAFLERVEERLADLLRTEAATLLLPGASIERLQVTRQIRAATRDLYRYLRRFGYRIVAVEEVVQMDSEIGPLHGRLDLRLEGRAGEQALLDLKWGSSRYRAMLAEGRAVQLAVYARAVAQVSGGPPPPAGYFALSQGEVLATDDRMKPRRRIDGASLDETLDRAFATAKAVLSTFERGRIPVRGTRQALPLLEALEIPEDRQHEHVSAGSDKACDYCPYDALCGRKWEVFA